MIVVTGAGGHLGRAIVDALGQSLPAQEVVAATRDPDALPMSATFPVEVRRCDFAEPETLDRALAGADTVLIMSVNRIGEEAGVLHRNAVNACVRLGVRRVFYTSHMGARAGSAFAPADRHFRAEADLAAAAIPFTALRHGFYAESCLQVIGDGLKTGDLRVPEDGPVNWTARSDLARADAALLARNAGFDGPTAPLTATEAFTMAGIAALAAEATGRTIRHTVISDEDWVTERIATGVPKIYADLLLGMFRAARNGDFAATDPLLGDLLGRAPRSMRDIVAETLAVG